MCIDVVHEGRGVFLIRVGVLHGEFEFSVTLLTRDIDDILMQSCLCTSQIFDEL